MMTNTKTNIIVIYNNSNNNKTEPNMQIDSQENTDGQNNSVTKELIDSTLITEEVDARTCDSGNSLTLVS